MSLVKHSMMPMKHAFYSGAFTGHALVPTAHPGRPRDVYASEPPAPVIAASGTAYRSSPLLTTVIPSADAITEPSNTSLPVVARSDLGIMLVFALSIAATTYAMRRIWDAHEKKKVFSDVIGEPDRITGSPYTIPRGITPAAVEALDAFVALAPGHVADKRLQILWIAKIDSRARFDGHVRIPHIVHAIRAATGITIDPLELKTRFQDDPAFADADIDRRRTVIRHTKPSHDLLRLLSEDDPGAAICTIFKRLTAFTLKNEGTYQPMIDTFNLGKAWWLFCSCFIDEGDVVPTEFTNRAPAEIPLGNLGPVPLGLIFPGLTAYDYWQQRIETMMRQLVADPLFERWFTANGDDSWHRGNVFGMLRTWDALPYHEQCRHRSIDTEGLCDITPDRIDLPRRTMSRLWALKTLEKLRIEEKLYTAYLAPSRV